MARKCDCDRGTIRYGQTNPLATANSFSLVFETDMWHRVAALDEIPSNGGREFTVNGRIVAVFHLEEEYVALDGICPHAGGPLADGTVKDTIVTCPWHGWQFDLKTGRHCLSSQITLPRFPVRVEGGDLFVELP